MKAHNVFHHSVVSKNSLYPAFPSAPLCQSRGRLFGVCVKAVHMQPFERPIRTCLLTFVTFCVNKAYSFHAIIGRCSEEVKVRLKEREMKVKRWKDH